MLHQLYPSMTGISTSAITTSTGCAARIFSASRAVGRLRTHQKLAAALVDQLFQITAEPQFVVHDHHYTCSAASVPFFHFYFFGSSSALVEPAGWAPRHTARHSKF